MTTEEILDQLSTLIFDLGAIREKLTDTDERSSINTQIMTLNKLWRQIDNVRASESSDELLANAVTALNEITKELKKEKKKLENIENVIKKVAKAISIAEKVLKLII